MPRFDNIFQFIVPLTFLAIWALTSLFNREAQPLPGRTGRPQPPGGPGKGMGTGGTSTTSRTEGTNRDPSLRWSSTTAGERSTARRAADRPDDAILIIEETRRGSGPSSSSPSIRSNAAPGSKRTNRTRSAPAGSPKRAELGGTLRALSGSLSSSVPMPQHMSRTLEMDPLAMPHSPLMASTPSNLSRTIAEATKMPDRPIPVTDDFRLLLNSPAKLREAIIVNEILQPPLSMRRRSV